MDRDQERERKRQRENQQRYRDKKKMLMDWREGQRIAKEESSSGDEGGGETDGSGEADYYSSRESEDEDENVDGGEGDFDQPEQLNVTVSEETDAAHGVGDNDGQEQQQQQHGDSVDELGDELNEMDLDVFSDDDELDEQIENQPMCMSDEDDGNGTWESDDEEFERRETNRETFAQLLSRNLGKTFSHAAFTDVMTTVRDTYDSSLPISVSCYLPNVGDDDVEYRDDKEETFVYAHFGLLKGLQHLLRGFAPNEIPRTVNIWLYIDGVTKYLNSSKPSEFWPLLMRVDNVAEVSRDLVTVGIYHGGSKPSNVILMEDFMQEYLSLYQDGWTLAGHDEEEDKLKLVLTCVIADAPGRQMCKGIKSHNAKNGCERCYLTADTRLRRTYYKVAETKTAERRTNEAFRANAEERDQHHRQTFKKIRNQEEEFVHSVFLDVPGFDMIRGFPLDPMHLCGLGVAKRLLQFLLGKVKHKLPRVNINNEQLKQRMDDLYLEFYFHTPYEFGRKPRTIQPGFWKAVEYFTGMCYTFLPLFYSARTQRPPPVTEKKRVELAGELYQLIVNLTVAMRIMCDPVLCLNVQALDDAQIAAENFVHSAVDICEDIFAVYSVHSFLHLVEDVKHLKKPLIEISAFKSENHFRHMMTGIRSGRNQFTQLTNYIHTKTRFEALEMPEGAKSRKVPEPFVLKKPQLPKHLKHCDVCETPTYTLNCKRQQDMFVDAEINGEEVPVQCMTFINNDIPAKRRVVVRRLTVLKKEMFTKPIAASCLSIRIVDTDCENRKIAIPLENLRRKLFRLPIYDKDGKAFVVIPLLHSKEFLNPS